MKQIKFKLDLDPEQRKAFIKDLYNRARQNKIATTITHTKVVEHFHRLKNPPPRARFVFYADAGEDKLHCYAEDGKLVFKTQGFYGSYFPSLPHIAHMHNGQLDFDADELESWLGASTKHFVQIKEKIRAERKGSVMIPLIRSIELEQLLELKILQPPPYQHTRISRSSRFYPDKNMPLFYLNEIIAYTQKKKPLIPPTYHYTIEARRSTLIETSDPLTSITFTDENNSIIINSNMQFKSANLGVVTELQKYAIERLKEYTSSKVFK